MMWINQVQDASGWDEVASMDSGAESSVGCAALGGKIICSWGEQSSRVGCGGV